MTKVSIIVNNYNYGRFLAQSIDSALTQDYSDKEVLVVDDGSKDNSRQVIALFGDRVLPVLKENGGQTSAFNAGLAASHGDAVLFLDADDFLLPGAVRQAVNRLADPNVVKVHWPLWVVDGGGVRSGDIKPVEAPPEGDMKPLIIEHGPEYAGWPPTSGNAWKRSYLQRVFPIPEVESNCGVGSASADAYLTMLAPLFGHVGAIHEPLSCYRVHGSNDHACLDFDRKLMRDVWVFDHFSRVLERYCREARVQVDPQRWRNNSWCCRLLRATKRIESMVQPGESFILVDDGQFCMTATPVRNPIPFMERDGQFWGQPADDREAIDELTRLARAGARYVVIAWPSFWWLDHFRGFAQHLRRSFRCVVEDDLMIAFDLATSPPAAA
ncbi:MAG: glycosyltransferase family 2 protein [Tepidisphaeraceae bacterium]